MKDSQNRSLSLEVFVADELRQRVINSVRAYRAACRQCYGVLLACQAAGGEVIQTEETVQLKPASDAAGAVMAAAVKGAVTKTLLGKRKGVSYTVKGGKGLAYDLRTYVLQDLLPSALGFVWDSLRRDIITVWQSRDPEFPKASRGWLALQGVRGIAQFQRRAIGCPVATAKPKLTGDTISLKWDREIGSVDFKLPRLDPGRYYVWKSIRDRTEGWSLGTVYLGEIDGQLRISLSYSRPAKSPAVDPERICSVTVDQTGEMLFALSDGNGNIDAIQGTDVRVWLKFMHARTVALEGRRAACGNPRAPWGHRRGWLANQGVLSRHTGQRERGATDRNHAWTRRIVQRAIDWRCGKVRLTGLPVEELYQFPWAWSAFRNFLAYKGKDHGIVVE